MKKTLLFALIMISPLLIAEKTEAEMSDYMLLDDFSTEFSKLNNQWTGITDRVMGGRSDITITRVSESDTDYIRMTGNVSLENNGGFIQIQQKLSTSEKVFDGSEFKGIRLTVRGTGSGYYIFLRTTNTLLPWQHFSSPIPVDQNWKVVDIPWDSFKKGDYGNWGRLKTSKLKSLAIVAYGEAFKARIDIKEIGFY